MRTDGIQIINTDSTALALKTEDGVLARFACFLG